MTADDFEQHVNFKLQHFEKTKLPSDYLNAKEIATVPKVALRKGVFASLRT